MKREKSKFLRRLVYLLGLLLCIFPPAIATLSYFPLWKVGVEQTLAGGAALLLVLSAYPLFKWVRAKMRSASAYVMWLILFLLFFALSKIADEMTVIAFVGFIGNILGALLMRLSRGRGDDK